MLIYPLLTVKINVYRAKKTQNKRKTSAFDQIFNVSRETRKLKLWNGEKHDKISN